MRADVLTDMVVDKAKISSFLKLQHIRSTIKKYTELLLCSAVEDTALTIPGKVHQFHL